MGAKLYQSLQQRPAKAEVRKRQLSPVYYTVQQDSETLKKSMVVSRIPHTGCGRVCVAKATIDIAILIEWVHFLESSCSLCQVVLGRGMFLQKVLSRDGMPASVW